ncbi:MAG: twin-arginine translocase subunit TatC [Halodesulfurarchaeum sp.]
MSGAIDEDTARAINRGRESIGLVLRAAQEKLQKVFIAFVLGLLLGIVAMRAYIWPALKADLLVRGASVIAQTPFDVILLQVKIGLALGIVTALPVLGYYAKEPLAEREFIPDVHVARWKLWVIGVLSLTLAVFGIVYAYYLFFPIMFRFLAGNAMAAGLAPLYSIVHWTQFIMVLAFSFGLAAQLPLAMTALSYSGIVPYETFRDYWKYAVVLIFTFGALFSPPDPFTQMMWALPLLVLYGFSLYLAKVVTKAKRGSRRLDLFAVLRSRWNLVLGAGVLGAGLAYAFFQVDGIGTINRSVISTLPAALRPGPMPTVGGLLGLPEGVAVLVVTVVFGLFVAVLAALLILYRAIGRVQPESVGDPYVDEFGLDLSKVEGAEGVRAAPEEVFRNMEEDDAVSAARTAMEADDPEKARAILDRFDEVQATDEAETGTSSEDSADGEETESGNPITSTTAGMVNAFTEDETTEDDIGGYYYDIAFILDSLRSRAFRITAVFMIVMASIFAFLYRGGIGMIRADFISRIPPDIRPDPAQTQWPITLHPVEALVFEVKIATVLAAIVTLPMVFYYAWPALEERGLIRGDRETLYFWGTSIVVGLIVGSVVGYLYVAPTLISYLVQDALRAGMTISYRVNNFFWMVFLTTAGIGLLADIPVTMWLFHRGGIVSYRTMRRRWRVAVLGFFVFGALVTPDSLYTMLLIAIPIALAYFLGLGILWVVTLGGRRGPRPRPDEGSPA